MTTLKVNEIFLSIQGESSWAGLACAFVRLTGCPLRCSWCDTAYAYDQGADLPLAEVVARARALGVGLAEVTGGEPLAQAGTPELVRALAAAGMRVLVETSGALDIGVLDRAAADRTVHVIMDVKCPGSGMSGRMHWPNLDKLRPHDEVKFVLAGRADYEYAGQVVAEHGLAGRVGLLLSPVRGLVEPRAVVEWMLADRLPARFQLQMHKYIWPPEARGV
jgi:7-carboxy-7-deazaguanine synthase